MADTKTSTKSESAEHSVDGSTTRDDALDAGVPMLPGDPSEPQGPEDALGKGAKRGDYRDRQDGAVHLESVPAEDAGEPVVVDGNVVDYKPRYRLEPQNPRVKDIGEVAGEKGGVTTD